MDCSADTMTNRLLQRSRSSPQADDNTTTIAKRLETYYRASIPVVAYYETKTQLHKVSHLTAPQNEPTTHFFFKNRGKKRGNFRFRVFGIRTALLLFSHSVMSDSATPWTAACQASLSHSFWSLLKLMSFESKMPSNHLILCHPLVFLPSIFPSIKVFS